MILAQSGTLAFGIVPDVLALDRKNLQRANHALDLNGPGQTTLSVGFVPEKQAFHTVFKEDLDRVWVADEPVENSYYLYIAGNAPAGQAYREAVRFHWKQFGRADVHFTLQTCAQAKCTTPLAAKQTENYRNWSSPVHHRRPRELNGFKLRFE